LSGGARRRLNVLVVTRMWPTERRSFRNGFLAVQVASVQATGEADCTVLIAQGRPEGWRLYLRLVRELRRAVASGDYDVVHAHYGLTGLAACCQRRLPVVVTFHGSDLEGAVSFKGGRTLKGRVEPILSSLVAAVAAQSIVVSPRLARRVAWAHPRVIPVGVDDRVFQPIDRSEARERLGLDQARRLVLFAGNPDKPVKRHALAQAAVDALRERYPDVELLTVFGRPMQEMPLFMSAADVLLVTSLYEGGPMVVREALACNLPVVTVDVGDAAERVRDVAECHVAEASADALAAALARVLENRSRSDGRKHIAPLTAAALAGRLVDVYREAASSAGRN
jgi:teichuronic acid biosynthesis glycosyltransferase TuaC